MSLWQCCAELACGNLQTPVARHNQSRPVAITPSKQRCFLSKHVLVKTSLLFLQLLGLR
jgi:hypothetical protein